MQRPPHLPDFSAPPLREVAIGVQFDQVPAYSIVHARDVWELYKNDFPNVQEMPALPPQFETFGGVNTTAGPQFFFGSAQPSSRLWFVSADQNRLLQFQPDRFLLNWNRQAANVEYPRYEELSRNYCYNLEALSAFFASTLSHIISINQVEITYVNLIPLNGFSDIGEWLSFWRNPGSRISNVGINFSEDVNNDNNQPIGRLYGQIQSVVLADGVSKAIQFSLIFRGQPSENSVAAAMELLSKGRELIVTKFSESTTPEAHRIWGKKN
jgi:uncharacterized protein (TIGR04255 family)